MKKALDYLTAKPARFFLLAALIWGGLMCYLNYKDGANFAWHDLLVEANGVVFDLLVFGVLLSAYEALREKKEKIERLNEEIDDFRGWDEKEAMYRIAGAIRRLNNLNKSTIQLSDCFLSSANLTHINLAGANLSSAILENSQLYQANLSSANLISTDFSFAKLREANIKMARLDYADLRNADLFGAEMVGANLFEANLERANLDRANLSKANLFRANLVGATFLESNLEGVEIDEAKVGIIGEHWFDILETWNVKGISEIRQKYRVNQNGLIILRKEYIQRM